MKGRERWRAYVVGARRRRRRAGPPDDARRGEGRATAPSSPDSSSWRSWVLNPSAASRQCGGHAMGGQPAGSPLRGEGMQCFLAGEGGVDGLGREKRADSTREASKRANDKVSLH